MNAHATISPRSAIAASVSPKTYEDYLADGRVWGAEKLAGARWQGSHDVESLARVYAEINAPVAVRKEYLARRQAEIDDLYGASGFGVGQYGLQRIGLCK